MLILADENIPLVSEAFSGFGEVRTLAGRQLSAADVKDADVLLVRSVTRVDEKLLAGSKVCFVGSATIGTDHVDLQWLADNNIQFANAPGCNAVSAAEYVLSALLLLDARINNNPNFDLSAKTLGIIGCGNVGSRVKARAEALGINCLVCDPPRAEKEGPEGFVDMQAIAQADIISVHVPLVRQGPYATRQLINAEFINQLKADAVFINTARGDVVDEAALQQRLVANHEMQAVLDVWENEPAINVQLADHAAFATPHIAGYSIDGKIRATLTLFNALGDFLGQAAGGCAGDNIGDTSWADLPNPQDSHIEIGPASDRMAALRSALLHVYDIRDDDARLREILIGNERAGDLPARAAAFDRLRKNYWQRRECDAYQIVGERLTAPVKAALGAFGFRR